MIGRMTRTNMALCLVAGSVVFSVIDWLAFGRLNLTINLGFRFEALTLIGMVPIWRAAIELGYDLALAVVAIARLHDATYSARWLVMVGALTLLATVPMASFLALVALLAWIAIIFLPPSIGPNRFGADPRGWLSREQFDAQQRELAAQKTN